MARLIGEYERTLGTDYAILNARQDVPCEGAETMTYAASRPGLIAAICGTKYAQVAVRVERWDERPPDVSAEWEDADELPWEPVPDAGPLLVEGFDPAPPGDGLPVGGLGRCRVQVLAAGRHRHRHTDGDPAGVERWLLRLWPDAVGLDALAGPPRRIAGPLPFDSRPRAWDAALDAWRRAAWDVALLGLESFDSIRDALARIGRPCADDELVPLLGPYGPQRERAGPYTWSSPALGHGWVHPVAETSPHKVRKLERVAAAAGMTEVVTFGDALDAMSRFGLLARTRDGRLVLNPAPRAASEMFPDDRDLLVQAGLRCAYGRFEGDLRHVLTWAPDGKLVTTPQDVAVRLALPAADVVGTLRLLVATGRVAVAPAQFDSDSEVTVTPRKP